MKVAIHQPQYLPWIPYFMKINSADAFIFLDTVDFQKNGIQNRNMIKTPQGPQWLTVPVVQKLGTKIQDTRIANQNWQAKHWKSIQQNYAKAPYFEQYAPDIQLWYKQEWQSLSELTIEMTQTLLSWMDIQTPIYRASQWPETNTLKSTELLVALCQKVGATVYISGIGGKAYMNEALFREAEIEIVYQPSQLPNPYPQCYPKAEFKPDLSALDMMLNCGKTWRDYL